MKKLDSNSGFVVSYDPHYKLYDIWSSYSERSALVESGYTTTSGLSYKLPSADEIKKHRDFSEAYKDVVYAFHANPKYVADTCSGFLFFEKKCFVPADSEGKSYWIKSAGILNQMSEAISAAQWLYATVKDLPDPEASHRTEKTVLASFIKNLEASAWPNAAVISRVSGARSDYDFACQADKNCSVVRENLARMSAPFDPEALYIDYFKALSGVGRNNRAALLTPPQPSRQDPLDQFLKGHRESIRANEKIECPKLFGFIKLSGPDQRYTHLRNCAQKLGVYLDYMMQDPDAQRTVQDAWRYRLDRSFSEWLNPQFMSRIYTELKDKTAEFVDPTAQQVFDFQKVAQSHYSEEQLRDEGGRQKIAEQIRSFSRDYCCGPTAGLLTQVADNLQAGHYKVGGSGDLARYSQSSLKMAVGKLSLDIQLPQRRFFDNTYAAEVLQAGYNMACIVDGQVPRSVNFPVVKQVHPNHAGMSPRSLVEAAQELFSHPQVVSSVFNARNQLISLLAERENAASSKTRFDPPSF